MYFITPAPRFVKDFLREDGSFVLKESAGIARTHNDCKNGAAKQPFSPCE